VLLLREREHAPVVLIHNPQKSQPHLAAK
jgi:hypothetical protein